MVRKLSRPRIAYGGLQTRCFNSCPSTWHLRQQKPRQLFATAGVSAEKGDMILERTAKGQTVFAQLLYAPRLVAQSAHAAPTQSRYTCDGAVKRYLSLTQAVPKSVPNDKFVAVRRLNPMIRFPPSPMDHFPSAGVRA